MAFDIDELKGALIPVLQESLDARVKRILKASDDLEKPYHLYYIIDGVKHELDMNSFIIMFTYKTRPEMNEILDSMIYIRDQQHYDHLRVIYNQTRLDDLEALNDLAHEFLTDFFA